MEELIFFAVIIFFSVLESIARSRRAKRGEQQEGPLPDPVEWEVRFPDLEPGRPPVPGDDDLLAYDDDPSYDDMLEQQRVEERRSRDGETLDRYARPRGTDPRPRPSPSTSRTPSRPSSETMLPGDLLEQLEALARGGTVEREEAHTIDLPKQSPPLPAPIERPEVGTDRASTDPVSITRRPEHWVHRSHAGYGTDPSERPPSEQDGLDPLAEHLDADGVAVRKQLFGGREALRQAFVLKEVLGPPKALREDDSVF